MQFPVLSLIIPVVSHNTTAENIVKIFYKLDIATIKRVTLLPVADVTDNVSNVAYMEIGYWHDTETAYRFIERLRDNTKECRIVYDDPLWWNVMENHDNYHVTYDPSYSNQTTDFIYAYGEEPVEAIKNLKEFFKTHGTNNNDYEMFDIQLDNTYKDDDYELYKYPLLLKEQDNDHFFTAIEWNQIMDEIVEEDEEFKKSMMMLASNYNYQEEDDNFNVEEYINDTYHEEEYRNSRREIILDRCY
jgi:hypothetical protein